MHKLNNLLKSINEIGNPKETEGKLFAGPFDLVANEVKEVLEVDGQLRFYFTGSGYVCLSSKSFNDKLFIDKDDIDEDTNLELLLEKRLDTYIANNKK